jgi:hypothetical protein
MGWEQIQDKIIAAKGCVVHGESIRELAIDHAVPTTKQI